MTNFFHNYRFKKQGLACFVVLSIWTILFTYIVRNEYGDNLLYMKDNLIKAYFEETGKTCYHDNLKDEEPKIKLNNSIFIISASCENYFTVQEICVTESVVRSIKNDYQSVYLLLPRDLNRVFIQRRVGQVLKELQETLQMKSFNIYKFIKETPLEGIFTDSFLDIGDKNRRVREVLKFAALYKYGGVVVDLEMLLLRSVDSLGDNWAPRVNSTQLGSAIFGLNKNTLIGKALLDKSIKLLINSQNETMLDGDLALTKAFHDLCDKDVAVPECADFRQYESNFFYPLNSSENYKFSEPGDIRPDAYGYYIWNKTQMMPIQDSLYMKLMSIYCPIVYKVFKE